MNKKILILTGIVLLGYSSFGQKAKLREANKEFDNYSTATMQNKVGDKTAAIKKAKEAIDAAAADPSTSNDAKTWLTKANIYFAMQEVESLASTNPYLEGVTALKKAIELNPKLEKDGEIIKLLYQGGVYAFNSGINYYNSSDFKSSYSSFAHSISLLGSEPDKKFILYPSADTIRSQAKMLQAYDAYYLNNTDEAIVLLKSVTNDPFLVNQPNIYLLLAQAYEKKQNKNGQLAIIEEGLKKYPADQNLKNSKLNYYVTSGDYKVLEDAIANDPNNVELIFNLGIIYQGLALPNDKPAPENSKMFLEKAETNYKKALAIDKDNGIYNFQLGAFYFNQAAEITKSMNDLPVSQNNKYNLAKIDRDKLFDKALPLLEKSKSIFASSGTLNPEQQNFQRQSYQALISIYTNLDQLKKASDLREEMNKL